MSEQDEVVAAGAVVFRRRSGTTEVLLVHRPKYDDWAFPKGKVDPGEHVVTAAVREVAEETGLDIRLGPPLASQTYSIGDASKRTKRVHYWVGRAVADDDVTTYRRNSEIDDLGWVDLDKARDQLTYSHDVDTLDEALTYSRKSHPLVVLRHGHARSRKRWKGDDRLRTLDASGLHQAEAVVPLLSAYGVTALVTSSSTRCAATLAPYAEVAGLTVDATDALSEQDATSTSVARQIDRLLRHGEAAVLCSHRPVLPLVLEALGVSERSLEPGAMLVAHHRHGRVLAVEQHGVPTT